MSIAKVVINVHGGLVQDVFASAQGLQVVLVDWDQEGVDPGRPELVEMSVGDHHAMALVCNYPVQAWAELSGSDVEQAIEAARRRGILNEAQPTQSANRVSIEPSPARIGESKACPNRCPR